MRVLLFAALVSVLVGNLAPAQADDAAPENVNSRYTIESVELSPQSVVKRLGGQLKADMESLVGQKFDQSAVDKIATRIGDAIHRKVSHRVERGAKPEHVKVLYEAPRAFEADADITKLAYHSKHGWTAGVESSFEMGGLGFRAGVQSDSDRLLERFAGYNLGVSRRFGDRVQARFHFGSFHQQWNPTTLRALESRPDLPGIYRERYHMTPSVSIAILEPLTLTVGLDIQHLQNQFPAARYEASNAVTTTLRYRRRWGSDTSGQEVDAGYSLRAATRTFDSDYVYTRHLLEGEYDVRFGEHEVSTAFFTGVMNGQAPLFERFSLGDTRTLRGWSRFDVAPVGGSRAAHASVEYTYRWIGFFYDTGSVQDRNESADVKHSLGVGVGGKDGFFLALAFPLRSGPVSPLFILGMNF